MKDFLCFRKMLAPILIQIMFWLVLASLLVVAIVDIVHDAPLQVIFQVIIIGPIVTRVVCEVLILFFRMNNTLTDINQNLSSNSSTEIS